MNTTQVASAFCALVFSITTLSANATLFGRLPVTPGGTDYQAAYDDVLDITWVTKADLSGSGTWDDQVAWADNLDYLGYTDWRLASMSVAAGLPTGAASPKSVIECSKASELACRDNELGYMFYHNMGGSRGDNKTGDQTVDGVLLTNVQSYYWTGTEFVVTEFEVTNYAGLYGFDYGYELSVNKDNPNNTAWAVRAGDVSAVPVPAAVWLFGSGLIGLVGLTRRRANA